MVAMAMVVAMVVPGAFVAFRRHDDFGFGQRFRPAGRPRRWRRPAVVPVRGRGEDRPVAVVTVVAAGIGAGGNRIGDG
jgi:hypothetical protein